MNKAQQHAGAPLEAELQPFHQAQGKRLTAVLSVDEGRGEELVLAFGAGGLVFSCNEDTDTIQIAFRELINVENVDDLTTDLAWSRHIGKEFSCGWLTVNQQGYIDGALLSFDGVVPEVGLNVVASAFEILEIRQHSA